MFVKNFKLGYTQLNMLNKEKKENVNSANATTLHDTLFNLLVGGLPFIAWIFNPFQLASFRKPLLITLYIIYLYFFIRALDTIYNYSTGNSKFIGSILLVLSFGIICILSFALLLGGQFN
jgi:hypothetical protein